jgi:hypothetical protein
VNAYSELFSSSDFLSTGYEPSSISVFGSRVKAADVESSKVFSFCASATKSVLKLDFDVLYTMTVD